MQSHFTWRNMIITAQDFGRLPDGRIAKIFRFSSSNGMEVGITNYGGIITSIKTPDRYGNIEEITAGFPVLEKYLMGHPHFGVIVGRYANRIAGGRFYVLGREYSLPINNGPNHLHGGHNGFHTKLWSDEIVSVGSKGVLKLTYHSPDGDEGYPGNLKVTVEYTITDGNEICIAYHATTDAQTHVNLTSHCYFNLNGFKNTIYDHTLFLDSLQYIEIDAHQIPTGILKSCRATPFDFSESTLLGERIKTIPGGIDHCFALNSPREMGRLAALLIHKPSGRTLEVYTTQPGIQVYTGNSLDGSYVGHNQTVYQEHSAICLETQHYPDSPNQPDFPSTLLSAGEVYQHETRMVFGID